MKTRTLAGPVPLHVGDATRGGWDRQPSAASRIGASKASGA